MYFADLLPPDATLVAQALSDKPAAFEKLVLRYQRKACAIARALGVPSSSVDDVVQESFLQALCGLRGLRSPASFGPWFLNIVRNLSRKEIESSRKPLDPARLKPDPVADLRVRAADLEDVREHIWREVSRLPEGIREAIFLYYHEGESVRRVAQALTVSTSAVKSRLQRGRDQLRQSLWRELEESLREMLPSTREWNRKGRRLALLLIASVFPKAECAGAGATAAEVSSGFLRLAAAGALILSAKKLFFGAALAALLITGVIAFVSISFHRPRAEGGKMADSKQSAPREPRAASATDAPPLDGERGAPAAKHLTGISGSVFLEKAPILAADVLVAAIFDGERSHAKVATTDAEGTFILSGLKPGKYRLWAWREDWTTQWPAFDDDPVEVREGEVSEGRNLTLVPGVIIDGQVVEEGTRRPVASAAVHFAGLQFATADGEGRFRLEGISEGLVTISAGAPGYARCRLELDAAHGESPFVTLELTHGGIIEGTVKDLSGSPAPGVDVTAQTGSRRSSGQTDTGGHYRIDGIPFMARDIELTASRGGCFAAHLTVEGFPPGEAHVVQDLQLEKGYTLSGRILNEAGQPVDGAKIHVMGSMIFPTFRSDAEGRFAIEGGSERMFSLSARKNGLAPASVSLRDLLPEHREKIELVLGPGHFVEGMVVDSHGGPIEGAFVYVELADRAGPTPSTRTDADGRFRLEDLPKELSEIGALKEGYADNRWNPVKADQRDVRLMLSEAAQIHGIVVDKATGAPVHPLVVKVSFAEGPFRRKNQAKGFGGGLSASFGREGLPFDFPDGRFKIRNGLGPGMFYKLLVVAPGYSEAVVDGVEAWPRSESREPVRMELEKGKALLGRVLATATGETVAGVKVSHVTDSRDTGRVGYWHDWRRGDDTPVRVAVTDAQGGFLLEGLPEAPGVLLLEKPGFARTAVFRAAPAPQVQIFELPPASIVEGTCRIANGEPLESATVEVKVEELEFPETSTDAKGFYRLGGLPAGNAEVEMRQHGSLKKHKATMLSPGEVTVLDFTQQSGAILGQVTEAGKPVPKAHVLVKSSANTKEEEWIYADPEGRFRVGGLDPGSYELKASRPDATPFIEGVSRTVEVGSGEVPCEISLTPAGGLSGRVIDWLSGNPVRGGGVTLFKRIPGFFSGGGFKFLGSDWAPSGGSKAEGDDARFHLEIAAAGSYLLAAQGGEGSVAQGWLGPLDLEPGGRAEELTVRVGGPATLAVTVRDARTSAALEGIGIILMPADGYPVWLFAKTDGSGSALQSSVPAGKYRLEVQSPVHLSYFEEIAFGEARIDREVSLQPASWIAVELGGSANPARDYVVKAALISGGDPAWPFSSADGRSLTMASTRGAGGQGSAAQATPDLKVRLKTRAGRYTIHFEVSSPNLNSLSLLAKDLELDVQEEREARVLLLLP